MAGPCTARRPPGNSAENETHVALRLRGGRRRSRPVNHGGIGTFAGTNSESRLPGTERAGARCRPRAPRRRLSLSPSGTRRALCDRQTERQRCEEAAGARTSLSAKPARGGPAAPRRAPPPGGLPTLPPAWLSRGPVSEDEAPLTPNPRPRCSLAVQTPQGSVIPGADRPSETAPQVEWPLPCRARAATRPPEVFATPGFRRLPAAALGATPPH